MGRRIEWYLVELERMLKGRVPLETLHELQTETKAHLEAAAASLTAKGCEPEASELEAVKCFGRPADVAWATLRDHDGRPGPWATWLVSGIALVAFLCPFAIWAFDISAYPLLNGWIVFYWFALTAFVAAGLWSRRPLLIPVSTTLGIAAIAMTYVMSGQIVELGPVGGMGSVPRRDASRILANEAVDREEFRKLIAEFDKGKQGFQDDELVDIAARKVLVRGPFSSLPEVYRRSGGVNFPAIQTYSYSVSLTTETLNIYRDALRSNSGGYRSEVIRLQGDSDRFYKSVRAAIDAPGSILNLTAATMSFGGAGISGGLGLALIGLIRGLWGWRAKTLLERRALA